MPSISELDIWNRALQKLGAKRVTSLTEDSANARHCKACYSILRQAELRSHPWSFSIKRASLAKDPISPAFGKANQYKLPSDFLCLRPPDVGQFERNSDWTIEGRMILTNDKAPLEIRYTGDITDTSLMDALFVEALASKMAEEMCEVITQSNSKKADAKDTYKDAVRKAKRANAIEKVPAEPAEDPWTTARR